MRTLALLPLVAPLVADLVAAQDAPLPTLELGARVSGELVTTDNTVAKVVFALRPETGGRASLCLDSFDFDAHVALLDVEGATLAQSGVGGLEQNARLAVEFAAEVEYHVVVLSSDGRAGAFELALVLEPVPLPGGLEGVELKLGYWAEAGRRARARGDTARTLTSQRIRGQYTWRIGRNREALEHFEAALQLAGEDPAFLAETRFAHAMLGALLVDRGLRGEALEHFDRALRALQENDDPKLHAFVTIRQADALLARLELDLAEERYTALRDLAAGHAGLDLGPYEARATGYLGRIRALRGDHERSRLLQAESIELAETLPGEEHANALYVAGSSLQLAGDHDGARSLLEQAIARADRDGPLHVNALLALEEIHRDIGDYVRARAVAGEALELAEERGHARLASKSLVRLARHARSLSQRKEAREQLERAREWSADPWHVEQRIQVLTELALLEDDSEAHGLGHDLLREALDLARSASLTQNEIRCRVNLGDHYLQLGDPEAARSELRVAIELAADADAAQLLARAKANLAEAELLAGEPETSLRSAEHALATLSSLGLEEDTLDPLRTIARARIELGQVAEAQRAVDRLMTALERTARRVDDRAGWRARRAALDGALPQEVLLLRLEGLDRESHAGKQAISAGFAAAGNWKGRELYDGLRRRGREGGVNAAEIERLPSLLGERTLLVEYATTTRDLLAYTLSPRGLDLIVLGERAQLEPEIEHYFELLSAPRKLGTPEEILEHGSRLFDALLAPVLRGNPNAERLVIVPTLALTRLPFEALVLGTKNKEAPLRFTDIDFAVDRYLIAYAPSSLVLAELAARPPRGAPGRVLLVADPRYDAAQEGRGGLEPLPGTRAEAFGLARLLAPSNPTEREPVETKLAQLAKQRDGLVVSPRFTLCLGRDASRGRILALDDTTSVLHCAAHGLIDPEDPGNTGIALSSTRDDSGFLSVTDVRGLEVPLELAVLSACETARGQVLRGEGLQSMANAFLQSGTRAVVASLWKVQDEPAADFMSCFYELYVSEGLAPGEALTAAKRAPRAGRVGEGPRTQRGKPLGSGARRSLPPDHPYYWAAYVYVGPPETKP
jgi:CHAT domain-containing protein